MALAVSISQKVLIKLTPEYLIIKLDFRKRNSYEKREKNGNYLVKLKHFFLSPVSYQNFSPVLLFHTVCLLDTREYLRAYVGLFFLAKGVCMYLLLAKLKMNGTPAEWKKSIITFCTQNINEHPNQKD